MGTLARRVQWVENETFGSRLDVWEFNAQKADMVVVCTNNGQGLKPQFIRMRHQIYKKDLLRLMGGAPGAVEITLIPIYRQDHSITYSREELLAEATTVEDVLAWYDKLSGEPSLDDIHEALGILITEAKAKRSNAAE